MAAVDHEFPGILWVGGEGACIDDGDDTGAALSDAGYRGGGCCAGGGCRGGIVSAGAALRHSQDRLEPQAAAGLLSQKRPEAVVEIGAVDACETFDGFEIVVVAGAAVDERLYAFNPFCGFE